MTMDSAAPDAVPPRRIDDEKTKNFLAPPCPGGVCMAGDPRFSRGFCLFQIIAVGYTCSSAGCYDNPQKKE